MQDHQFCLHFGKDVYERLYDESESKNIQQFGKNQIYTAKKKGTQDNTVYIAKKFSCPKLEFLDQVWKELSSVVQLKDHRNPNVIKYIDAFLYEKCKKQESTQICILIMEKGDQNLNQFCQKPFDNKQLDLVTVPKNKQINQIEIYQNQVYTYLKQTLNGFKFLKQNSIYHRDYKPQNLVLVKNQIKIIDFDIMKMTQIEVTQQVTDNSGTLLYMDPNVNQLQPSIQTNSQISSENKQIFAYNIEKSDIFSIGLTFLKVSLAWEDQKLKQFKNKIQVFFFQKEYEKSRNFVTQVLEEIQNQKLRTLLQNMLELEVKKRWNLIECLNEQSMEQKQMFQDSEDIQQQTNKTKNKQDNENKFNQDINRQQQINIGEQQADHEPQFENQQNQQQGMDLGQITLKQWRNNQKSQQNQTIQEDQEIQDDYQKGKQQQHKRKQFYNSKKNPQIQKNIENENNVLQEYISNLQNYRDIDLSKIFGGQYLKLNNWCLSDKENYQTDQVQVLEFSDTSHDIVYNISVVQNKISSLYQNLEVLKWDFKIDYSIYRQFQMQNGQCYEYPGCMVYFLKLLQKLKVLELGLYLNNFNEDQINLLVQELMGLKQLQVLVLNFREDNDDKYQIFLVCIQNLISNNNNINGNLQIKIFFDDENRDVMTIDKQISLDLQIKSQLKDGDNYDLQLHKLLQKHETIIQNSFLELKTFKLDLHEQNSQIIELDLVEEFLKQRDLQQLIINYPNQSINTPSNGIQVLFPIIGRMIKLNTLNLDLGNNFLIKNDGIKILTERLQNIQNLKDLSLNLSNNELSSKDFLILSEFLKQQKQLEKLSLILSKNILYNAKQYEYISFAIQSLSQIQSLELDISYCKINKECLQYLKQGINKLRILKLNFEGNEIHSDGVNELCEIFQQLQYCLENLQLNIGNNKIECLGTQKLGKQIEKMYNLESLKLDFGDNNNIGSNGANNLGISLIEMRNLHELRLIIKGEGNKIGQEDKMLIQNCVDNNLHQLKVKGIEIEAQPQQIMKKRNFNF